MSPNRAIVALAAAASLVVAAPRTTRTAAPPPTYGPADDLVIPLERFHRAELVAGHTASPPPTAPAASEAPAKGGAWACVLRRESGGNYRANTGNGYYGAAQWLPSTWNAAARLAGHPEHANGRADLAPPSVQDAAASAWQAAHGWGPWPNTSRACGLR
jgi:hypothetical protein